MKEISEQYKKVLQSLEEISDGEDRGFDSLRVGCVSKKPKDLISSLMASRSNKVHIPKISIKPNKQKRMSYFIRRQDDTDLSDLFLKITTKLDKENRGNPLLLSL